MNDILNSNDILFFTPTNFNNEIINKRVRLCFKEKNNEKKLPIIGYFNAIIECACDEPCYVSKAKFTPETNNYEEYLELRLDDIDKICFY